MELVYGKRIPASCLPMEPVISSGRSGREGNDAEVAGLTDEGPNGLPDRSRARSCGKFQCERPGCGWPRNVELTIEDWPNEQPWRRLGGQQQIAGIVVSVACALAA